MTTVYPIQELTSRSALTMLEAAQQHAEQLGVAVCICVVGPQGLPLASLRMNAAPLHSVQYAEHKAYTAVSFKRPSHEWHEKLAGLPPQSDMERIQQALAGHPKMLMLGGGLPVFFTQEFDLPTSDSASSEASTLSSTSAQVGQEMAQAPKIIVGAVGVSGASVAQDIECAEAAIAALEALQSQPSASRS